MSSLHSWQVLYEEHGEVRSASVWQLFFRFSMSDLYIHFPGTCIPGPPVAIAYWVCAGHHRQKFMFSPARHWSCVGIGEQHLVAFKIKSWCSTF